MGKKLFIILGFVLLLLFIISAFSIAQEDVPESKDHPLLSRMLNFYIVDYREKEFDQMDFKNSEGKDIKVAGRRYDISYEIKEEIKEEHKATPSELQILRNYENALKKIGGTLIYEDSPEEAWLRLEKGDKTYWIYVFAHCDGECYELLITEKQEMAQEVIVEAKSLAKDIQLTGHASVYGIYFDFDKAEVKPESEPALKEIAKLLRQNPQLNLYVVGHTDYVGEFNYNMKLSQKRAEAIVKILVSKYGISPDRLKAYGVGPLAPVVSNKTEEGRSLNRRVELVEQQL